MQTTHDVNPKGRRLCVMKWFKLCSAVVVTFGLTTAAQADMYDLFHGWSTDGSSKCCGCASACQPCCCKPVIVRPCCPRLEHCYQRQCHCAKPACCNRCCEAPKCCAPAPTCGCPAPACCQAPHCCGLRLRIALPSAARHRLAAAGSGLCSEVLRSPALLCSGSVLRPQVLPGSDPAAAPITGLCPALLCPRLRSALPDVLPGSDLRLPGSGLCPALLCPGSGLRPPKCCPAPTCGCPAPACAPKSCCIPAPTCCPAPTATRAMQIAVPARACSLPCSVTRRVSRMRRTTRQSRFAAHPCEVANLIYASQTACYGHQRAHAVHKLGAFDCQCNPEILSMIYSLNDADEHVRREAAIEIGVSLHRNSCCCSKEVVAALTCALGDCDRSVRRSTGKGPASVPRLRSCRWLLQTELLWPGWLRLPAVRRRR